MALRCEYCYHTRFIKSDKKPFEGRRWWKCARCGELVLGYRSFEQQKAKELYIDIETAPMKVLAFDLYVPSKHISPDHIERDWFIICWSALWLGADKVISGCVTPAEAKAGDDCRILYPLWTLLDGADVVWGHNVNGFDDKKIRTRLLINGFDPPERYKTLDTLSVARKLAFSSRRLEYINSVLGLREKTKMEFADWKAIVHGDKKTLKRMAEYNRDDVLAGVETVGKLREWIVPFPPLSRLVK